MSFILRMVGREIRSSWRRLLFFFLCIAIGVASIVSIRSVIQNVRAGLTRETRALTGADVVVSSNRPFTNNVIERIERERREGRVSVVAEAAEMPTMVRGTNGGPAKMVELRAVPPVYPIYGTLTLHEGTYSHAMLSGRGVLVRPELLTQLQLQVGDELVIGTQSFEIRGVIDREPGRNVGSFSLGSRVIIGYEDLAATGLVSFGSRVSRQLQLQVRGAPEVATNVARALTQDLPNDFVRVRSYQQLEDDIGEDLQRSENYLSLVGLVVLILGGIGVSSVTRVFVQQKVRSIAILKCVGASSSTVLALYLAQVLVLGLAGSVVGVLAGGAAVAALPRLVPAVVPLLPPDYGLTPGAVLQGLGIGVLVSLLFSLVPLLDVRNVKPSLLLRQEAPAGRGIDWLKWTIAAGVAAALVATASWQAGSARVGLVLSGGFVGLAIVLHLAGMALVRAVQPLRHARSFALRHAVLHVARPGNQTRVILLAVGLGTFFVLGVRGLQVNLLTSFSMQLGENSPDMFLLDIQDAQRDRVAALMDAQNGEAPAPLLIPVLRARIVGVRGREVNLETFEDVRERGRGLSREYTITYRAALNPNETLVRGQWWGSGPGPDGPEVSIEEGLRQRLNVQIGDEMRFDVLGRQIAARVTSTRDVDFRDARAGGFMLVFRPGAFDGAPHSYIATVRGPADTDARARMQSALVAQFPNVSVIDLRDILQTVKEIVDNVTLAVTVVGALVLFSGALILIGAVSMTKFRRVYEAAILKTLGASSRTIATMLLLEYGVLGAIAGTIGALGAVVLSWAVAYYVLELEWQAVPLLTISGIVATAVFVAVIGVAASWDVLRHKPLATLRAE